MNSKPIPNFVTIVRNINASLPLHSMWDGFWINTFRKKSLVISCSFDRIYYRNYDLVFKKVIFFNLPQNWRDTEIYGDDLIHLATREEFAAAHPQIETEGYTIFAIDIHFERPVVQSHRFYIVAKNVFLFECKAPHNLPEQDYTDPCPYQPFPCKENRVELLKLRKAL